MPNDTGSDVLGAGGVGTRGDAALVSFTVLRNERKTVSISSGSWIVFGRGAPVLGSQHVDLPYKVASRQAVTVGVGSDGRVHVECGQSPGRLVVSTHVDPEFARLRDGEGLLMAPGTTYTVSLVLAAGTRVLTAEISTPVREPGPKPPTGHPTRVPWSIGDVMREEKPLSWMFVTAFAMAVVNPDGSTKDPRNALLGALNTWTGNEQEPPTVHRRVQQALAMLGVDQVGYEQMVPTLARRARERGVLIAEEVQWLRDELAGLGFGTT